jgi:hypothetical protein
MGSDWLAVAYSQSPREQQEECPEPYQVCLGWSSPRWRISGA